MIELFVLLTAAHFVCDYPLQGEFIAFGKNAAKPLPGVPWYQPMLAHVSIHAVAVYLITGLWVLAMAEFLMHFITDHAKCHGRLTYNQDQAIHIGCKAVWAAAAVMVQ